ncbi:MAG: hypothetical protein LBJ35_00025, partial [Spirochaetaceae bacterium]|nr:hypothetical protein [Spirochaetaceae bacterium]
MKYVSFTLLLCSLIFSAASCKTVARGVEQAGRFLDGTIFTEKTIKVYQNNDTGFTFRIFSTKDGERRAALSLKAVPYIQFLCTEPDETGAFFITGLHFLFSNIDGWMEGDMDVSGAGELTAAGDFSIDSGGLAIEGITRGGIRRRDRSLSGERALTELRNRDERIMSVVNWMKERSAPPDETAVLIPPADFEKDWKPVLLPETVPAKLRPARFNELNGGGGKYSYGEDVRWNSSYTQEIFPEHLRQIRDSGSLLRDW